MNTAPGYVDRFASRASCPKRALWLMAALTLVASVALAAPAQTPPIDPDPALRELLVKAIDDSTSFRDRYHAEVWLVDMSGRLASTIADASERLRILRTVHREATRADLSPELVLAVIQVESNFDRYAISSAGAEGLMQIMPFWLDEIGHPDANLFHIETNLRMGCTILKYYLDRSGGKLFEALARYNGSYGKPDYPERVFRALNRRWYAQ